MSSSDLTGRRRIGKRRIALVAVLLLALFLVGLWTQRMPIAQGFVDDALAARGVPASYSLARIGFGTQRIERIRLGDPAAPDLVADWAEIRVGLGLGGPTLRAVRAGGVRLNGRIVDGKLSLGSLDRLMPPPSDAPFELPDLDVDLSDTRVRLATPLGITGIALDGRGNLSGGFRGKIAAIMARVDAGGCAIDRPTAYMNVSIVARRPALDGPVRARSIACASQGVAVAAPRAAVDVAFAPALDRWQGQAVADSGAARLGAAGAARMGGRIGFDGSASRIGGSLALFAERVAHPSAAAGRATFDGEYRLATAAGTAVLDGDITLTDATADARSLTALLGSTQGTPVAPIAATLADAVRGAAGGFDARARIALASMGQRGGINIERLDATSDSGARVTVRPGAARGGIGVYWPSGRPRVDGELLIAGGGFPSTRVALSQASAGAPLSGVAEIAPIAAGGARIALTPVRFAPAMGGTSVSTSVTLDGPIADGRVEGLTLPIDALIARDGGIAVNRACAPLGFRGLTVAGMRLGQTRLPLCPQGGAMLLIGANGAIDGGARIDGLRLNGAVGGAPLTIAMQRFGFTIGTPGFAADAVAIRLADSRLDVDNIAGTTTAGALGGRFTNASGKIGAVPLLLSEANGGWALADGVLSLDGGLMVADSEADPRFRPLASRDMRLVLKDGIIDANGTLVTPDSGVLISRVAIRHDLGRGSGSADLDVPGIRFVPAGLQPEMLTRLTLGVIANVDGEVAGRGRIAWSDAGVTSTGTFRTERMDLAAAFGPVAGLKGEIYFNDLLGLQTPPGQMATVASINTGIAVTDGVVRYQLLPELKVKVERGEWPFSGGTLSLDETILDFAEQSERRLTFRVVGMDAALFVEQFDFKNIAVTGTFDGVLPIIFDQTGGRITGGRMVVRRGGGTLAYVGEVSNADLGMFGKLAFDALKSIKYDSLAIELDGALDGEIVSRVIFEGVNEAPLEGPEKLGMFQELTGLPFKFNIRISAPFRSLINSAQSLTDPRGLIGQSLPQRQPLPGSSPPADAPAQPPIQPPVQPK